MLKNKIISHIKNNGPMSISEYMSTCLYDTEYGYYTTRNPFGKNGDFTTAPEISPLFGELIGAWIGDMWLRMGSPTPFNLVEVGSGQGTLMSDIIRTLKKVLPNCLESANIHLVETSPHLTKIQKENLVQNKVSWHQTIKEIAPSTYTILIANEVLDAFPVRQFTRENNTYKERLIALDENNEFTFILDSGGHHFQTHQNSIEVSSERLEFLMEIKQHIQNGVALFLDYGADAAQPYATDSLQAIQKHQFVNPLTSPGNADLTTHVNFNEVRQILGKGCSATIPMGLFLNALGLPLRAHQIWSKLESEEEKQALEQTLYRLTHPDEMGEIFKVIGYRTRGIDELPALPDTLETHQPHQNNARYQENR